MALTIEQSPPTYSPVFNETVFVLSSTNVGNQDFTLRATIKDSAGDTLALVKIPPRPDDFMVIDIGRIVESEVSYDFRRILNQTTGIQQSLVYERYSVEFQEEFGSGGIAPSGGIGAITTASGYVYNADMRHQNFVTYDQDEWLLGDAAAMFLTNSPREVYIQETESAELGMMLDSAIGYISVKTYTASGALIQEATIINTIGLTDADKFLSILTGPDDLNGTTFDTGTQPIVDSSNVSYYTVQARTGSSGGINAAASEVFRYTLDRDNNCKYTPIRLHFLNRMGHFDSFTFKLLSRQTIDKQVKSFKKFTGDIVGSAWVNTQSARGNVTFDTQNSYQVEVNSDWIDEDASDWLQELFNSPVIFWQETPGDPNTTYAVSVTEKGYEVKQRVNDRLFNLTLRIELSIQDTRQRA